MEISYTCQAASSERANDDFVMATERFVIVLDGATEPVGIDSGCIHNVPWLVAKLATHLSWLLISDDTPLVEVLRQGIAATMARHADTCDMTNGDSPSTTVAILRQSADVVDYAVLGDSAILIEKRDGELIVAHDDRTSYLPEYTLAGVSRSRNSEGGFWIASNRPDAAEKAVAGTIPLADVTRVAVMTDGVTRLVERYGREWSDLLERLDKHGPAQLVADVRQAELATEPGTFRGKAHDDVTVVFCRF